MMLRDHSRPCEHGFTNTRKYGGFWKCKDVDCPGGAPVEIDYEAAGRAVWAAFHPDGDHIAVYSDVGRAAVNAALGIVEVDDG